MLARPTILHGGAQSATEMVARTDGSSAADPQRVASDMTLANAVQLTLKAHYPGYLWGVIADGEQGIVQILMPTLSDYCYVLHTKHLTSINTFEKKVMDAGGQFLERYDLRRGPIHMDAYLDIVSNVTPETKRLDPNKF